MQKKMAVTFVIFMKNAIFRRKLVKIAQNSDCNIDPLVVLYISRSATVLSH
jgi:hypothetical protein